MAEARKRNPHVILDCLPWTYPHWIKDRFSQDSADWFAAFLQVARQHYGLELDWVSAAQNENGTDLNWLKTQVRPTLDARGFSKVKLQAPDDDSEYWADLRRPGEGSRTRPARSGRRLPLCRRPRALADRPEGPPRRHGEGQALGQAAVGERGMEPVGRAMGRQGRALPGAADQQALHPRPHHQVRDLVPHRLDL